MTDTRAILIERHGEPGVLVERDIQLRDPAPDEVELRVHAVGVNFADLLMRAGLYDTVPPRPYSPGFEVAGEITRLGSQVTEWQPGDRAVALLRHGGYAHDVLVPSIQLFHYPETLTPAEAAAVPVVFLTAWVCLFDSGNARRGETALVLGAGGGVGTAAVQLAVQHGLRVIGTAGSERKRSYVVDDLGAEACFDSRHNWEPEVLRLVGARGIDIALDSVGGRATAACRRLLAPLGRLVFYGFSEAMPRSKRSWLRAARAWLRMPLIHPLSLVQQNIGVFGVHLLHLQAKEVAVLKSTLDEIYRCVTRGELHSVVDRVFPLDRQGAIEAHRYIHARKNLGKVVLADTSGLPKAR
ncbi:MAG: zinc-binding dehydrogenase [Gemmatimonadota bacterium]|nr:MAG: zinc-binding dehydrogenase [Gemmatimonadota bacterium]